MRILIIGGRGTMGTRVKSYLSQHNEVIIAGRSGGDVLVDISNEASIETLFKHIGSLDAIICTAGEAKWAPFMQLCESDFYIGLKSKLMGQINVVCY